MTELELVLALLVPVAAFATLARGLGLPYPILLVLGGLLLGLVPGLPHAELAPDVVFLIFLPPLIYHAAYLSSGRDLRQYAGIIARLAVGLVVATTAVVGVVAHAVVPGISWPVALLIGAIVSPPDAVAATAVLQRLGAPRKMLSILEGESLLNDATALVLYRAALAAVVTGALAPADAAMRVLLALGGVLVGLAVGAIVAPIRRRLDDPPVEILISLLTPYAAYLPAERLGLSGVLAAAAAGLYLGRRAPELMQAQARVSGRATWDSLIFVLHGLVFILIGLQLPVVAAGLAARDRGSLLAAAGAVSLAAIGTRLVWMFATEYPLKAIAARRGGRRVSWQSSFVAGWAGMRGVVSLAAALALPTALPDGRPFPERDLVLFLTFAVILVTLVGQGLTLPWLMGWLRVGPDGAEDDRERQARLAAARAAAARIQRLAVEWPGHVPLIDALRAQYDHLVSHLVADGDDGADGLAPVPEHGHDHELLDHRRIRRAVVDAERDAVQELFARGALHDEQRRRIERDLDLEELRMEG
jgi:CPA1 family monovalent cation:H+ antiporter